REPEVAPHRVALEEGPFDRQLRGLRQDEDLPRLRRPAAPPFELGGEIRQARPLPCLWIRPVVRRHPAPLQFPLFAQRGETPQPATSRPIVSKASAILSRGMPSSSASRRREGRFSSAAGLARASSAAWMRRNSQSCNR